MTYAGSEKMYKLGYNAALNDCQRMIFKLVNELNDARGTDALLKLVGQLDITIKQLKELDNDRRSK